VLLLCLPLTAFAGRYRQTPILGPDLRETAAVLLGRSLASDEPWRELTQLADDIGPRLSGSEALNRAITWAAERMREDGLTVTLEPVDVPVWVRGEEQGTILSPVADQLPLLGLGWTVATPPEGIDADVLVVASFDELTARAAEAKGRIVVFDVPFTTYGDTVKFRWAGPEAAAKVGAVAVLVRSVSPESLSTPHTGSTHYADGVPKIPAAAITLEDATRLHRWQESGRLPRLHLKLSGEDKGTAPSFNVVGELRGWERPNEVVVIGGHLDSWDVGQGAQDDGAGCVASMAALDQLAALPVHPRRTVRVVLFTNEEDGGAGGRAYAAAHANERIVYAIEDDTGAGVPLGFQVEAHTADGADDPNRATQVMSALAPWRDLLTPLGADTISLGHSGADVGPLLAHGTIGFGLEHDMSGYWRVHHTEADTLDKIDPMLVRRNAAALTVFTWLLAETPDLFDGTRPLQAQP
jgi:carboxypeptidase Q